MNEFFKKPVVKILMLKGEKGDKKTDADYDYRQPFTNISLLACIEP